jgi:hypothetical protein
VGHDLEAAFTAFAEEGGAAATVGLMALDRRLAALPRSSQRPAVMRMRARLLVICDAFGQHQNYFDPGASR